MSYVFSVFSFLSLFLEQKTFSKRKLSRPHIFVFIIMDSNLKKNNGLKHIGRVKKLTWIQINVVLNPLILSFLPLKSRREIKHIKNEIMN